MRIESKFPAWAWWIIGAVTILAVSILIFSVVLGIRAGQQQIELQQRQQIGIALQQAIDHQTEGNLQAAFDQYQKVLVLDPSNAVAQQGIKNLLALASDSAPATRAAIEQPVQALASATAISTVSTPAPVTSPTPVPASSAAVTSTVVAYWENAQNALNAGRWQAALDNLTAVQQLDPSYRGGEVKDLLFQTYVNFAAEKDNDDNLEEALLLYDKALQLRPAAADIQIERDLIDLYLEVLTYADVDWPRAIALLEQLYAADPQYRDVLQRLQEAYVTYGDELAVGQQWCKATDEYALALTVANRPEFVQKHSAAETQCSQLGDVAGVQLAATTVTSGAGLAAAPDDGFGTVAAGGPANGRILYSAVDIVTGRTQIMAQLVGKNTPAQLIVQDATQAALRTAGDRMVFRNLRGNMAGLSSLDPDTGLMLRFTEYAEDSLPSWNPQGSRLAFASNREGDRRWRIYLVWAETEGTTDTLGYGEAPAWHPSADLIAFRGCDASGNGCGLWTMSSSGADRAPLTTVPDDTRPAWSSDGSFVAFMSSGRDGNFDVYRVDVATGAVTRLTDSPANDGLPTVSPDGAWVAFVSNRDGSWKLWVVPSSGGQARVIAPIVGDLGNWLDQGLQWTN